MADRVLTKAGGHLFHQPAFRTEEFTPAERDKVCKALRVYALRLYLRLQFELALLRAKLVFLKLCEFTLQLAISAKSLFKQSLCQRDK